MSTIGAQLEWLDKAIASESDKEHRQTLRDIRNAVWRDSQRHEAERAEIAKLTTTQQKATSTSV